MSDLNSESTVYHQGADRSLVILYVHGSDSRDYLQRMVSCDLARISPEQGSRGTLLDGKGRIQAVFDLLQWNDGFLLVTGEQESTALKSRLESLVILEDVEIETDSHIWLHLYGAGAPERLRELGYTGTDTFLATTPTDAALLVFRPRFHPRGYDLLVAVDHAEALASSVAEMGEVATEALREQGRILLGMPKSGAEMGDRTLPPEVGLGDAVAYDKGCYAGQEVLARIRTYGHVNREIRCLDFMAETDSTGPAVGDDLWPVDGGDKPIGKITSVTPTPTGWAAIASLRYKFLQEAEASDAAEASQKVVWNRGGDPELIGALKPVYSPQPQES